MKSFLQLSINRRRADVSSAFADRQEPSRKRAGRPRASFRFMVPLRVQSWRSQLLRHTFSILALVTGSLLWSATSARAEFRAGAAAVNITPSLGIAINGGIGPGTARHVHDDLFAKSLVLDDGRTRLAFVVVDACLIDREVFDAAKQLAEQHTGIPVAHMMMSCTHTHSAGAVTGVHLCEPDLSYRSWLPQRLSDAVRRAVGNLGPAQAGWGRGALPQHVFCRRLLIKPGMSYTNQLGVTGEKAKMNWDSPHPADGDPAGPVDPEVFVLSLRHRDGRPLALLANYSLHYVGDVGPGHISADYFGVFADRVQQLLHADRQDPPFVGILANGTSGDINNINPRARNPSPAPYTQIRRVAFDLADEVLRVMNKIEHRSEVALQAASMEFPVGTRRPANETVARARQTIGDRPVAKLNGWKDNYARDALILEACPETVSMPLQVFRIGDVSVAAWPGEIFASSGLELKRRSALKPLFNVGMANGWYGYIPPPEQHAVGAYETWLARTSFLETNATVKMIDAFLGLVSSLR